MIGRKKATILTAVFTFFNSFSLIIFNIIYTRMLLKEYGSEINGLISTITQFVSFFSVIEGGFTTAAIVATYKPFAESNYNQLSHILYTIRIFLRRITVIIVFLVLTLGFLYIKVLKSPFDFFKTYGFLLISVSNVALNISVLSKRLIILQGSNREFIASIFAFVSKIISWALSIWLIIKGVDVFIVYSCTLLNVILNVVLIFLYEYKKYPNIVFKGCYDKTLIHGTKDVFIQKIANTIFNSTDLILVSGFIGLSASSVFYLYTMIFRSVSSLVESFVQAPFNSFGNLVAQDDKEKVKSFLSMYWSLTLLISNVLFTTTGITIIPFVKIYTNDINDYNYIYPLLVLLFYGQYICQIFNRPFGTILNVNKKFKEQNLQCGIGAILNIILSLSFIKVIGIYSIVFGSFSSVFVILIMNIYKAMSLYDTKSILVIIVSFLSNFFLSSVIIVRCINIYEVSNYFEWVAYALIVGIIVAIIMIFFNTLVNFKNMHKLFNVFIIKH